MTPSSILFMNSYSYPGYQIYEQLDIILALY